MQDVLSIALFVIIEIISYVTSDVKTGDILDVSQINENKHDNDKNSVQ